MQQLTVSPGQFPHNAKVNFFYRLFKLPDDAEEYVELLSKVRSDPAAQLTSIKELWAPNTPNELFAHVLWSQVSSEVSDGGLIDGAGPGR